MIVLCRYLRFVTARLARFDWRVEEASRDLVPGLCAFFMVVLPAYAGYHWRIPRSLCCVARRVHRHFFTIGGRLHLSDPAVSKIRYSIDPSINAIGTILLLLSTGTMCRSALWTIKIYDFASEDLMISLRGQRRLVVAWGQSVLSISLTS